jgi:RNA polymerase sigma factor (sigma-70 family)
MGNEWHRPNAPVTRGGRAFASTQWSVVLGARSDSAHRRDALERLCGAYWLPIYSHLRRRGHSPDDSQDLTQSFLAYLISSDFLDRPDPEKGRFRGYLIGALRHFLSHHYDREHAQKRGGGVTFSEWTTLDPESQFAAIDQAQLDPSEAYERGWALTLLARALARLEAEQTAAGRGKQFALLREYLSLKPTRGDYEQAAQKLGTSRTTIAVWIHRLNQRYAELVEMEVADTVRDAADVPQEMQHLLQALRR